MNALLEIVAWNSLAALVLALLVLVAGRVWKRPELLHVLWLVVLIKLVTPAVIRLEALPDLRPVPPAIGQTVAAAAPVPIAQLPSRVAVPASVPRDWSRVWSGVWVGGSALFLAWMLSQCLLFARTMRRSRPADDVLLRRIAAIAGRLDVKPPRVRVLDSTVPPMVWGRLGGATLVLPTALLARLEADETDTLLAHELAHLKRRDPWIRWVELSVTVMLWWNPLVWWVRRRLRQAEEQACDRWVLETFPEARRAYADGIVKTVEFLAGHGRPPQFAAGAAGTRPIQERLTMILNPSTKRRLRHPLVPALVLALLALPIVPGFADRGDAENERTRAEILDLEREVLELEERLQALRFERIELEKRLQETESRREQAGVQVQVEELRSRGEREQADELEAKLALREALHQKQRAHEMELLDRERRMSREQVDLREAKIELERAREYEDAAAVEAYERALAEHKRSLHDQASEMKDARRDYERVDRGIRALELAEGDRDDTEELKEMIKILEHKLRAIEKSQRKQKESGAR